jgi:hypothetical protein
MRQFFGNKLTFVAIAFLFTLALAWNLSHGSDALGLCVSATPTVLSAHGPVPPDPSTGGVRVAHGPVPPDPSTGSVLLAVAHGPVPPDPPIAGVRVAHGPVPPDPPGGVGVRVAHGPVPPDPPVDTAA